MRNKINYKNGFFRLTNGNWQPAEFARFIIDGHEVGENKYEFFVMGIQDFHAPALSLAGPFSTKEAAQKALDNFFFNGEMDDN